MSQWGEVEQAQLNAAAREYEAATARLIGAQDLAAEQMRPSMLLHPRLFIDGNKWCALCGENLQDGVAGFGDSPDEAFRDLDANWVRKLPAANAQGVR